MTLKVHSVSVNAITLAYDFLFAVNLDILDVETFEPAVTSLKATQGHQ